MSALVFLFVIKVFADDPRLANPVVQSCLERVETYLKSSDFREHRAELIGACRDVDAKCVRVAGDSISSEEHSIYETFAPVIKACKGRGTGDCLAELFNQTASYDRRTAKQVLQLLKTCN